MIHIHWYKVASVDNKYYTGGFYAQTIKKKCRCGAVKMKIKGYL